MVKPSWKKLETYIIIALLGSAMYFVNAIVSAPPGALGLPPQYATIIAGLLATGAPILLGYFAKLRHDAYAKADIPDPDAQVAQAAKDGAGAQSGALKGLALVLGLGIALAAGQARAQGTPAASITTGWHVGVTGPLFELRAAGTIFQASPGLGVQAWRDFGPVSADLAVFGSALGLGTLHSGSAVSAAVLAGLPFPGVAPQGVYIGPGVDLGGSIGGLFKGFGWANVFLLFGFRADVLGALHLTTAEPVK